MAQDVGLTSGDIIARVTDALAGSVAVVVACGAATVVGGLLERLAAAEGIAGYAWIAAGTLAGGVGVPIPEEAVLGVAGWLASIGRISLVGAYLAGWTCIVGWDIVLHAVGRRLGPRVEASWFGRRIGPRRFAAGRRFFERHGGLAVGTARFVMGTRIAVFLLAGAAGMSRGRFLAIVAPLALISCAIPIALGYALGPEAQAWIAGLEGIELAALALAALVVGALWLRSRARAKSAAPATPATADSPSSGRPLDDGPSPGASRSSSPPTTDPPRYPGTP